MPRVSEMTRPYFSHDEDARGDDKILKLFFSFRKLAKEMSREDLESFVPIGAYGIFWSILEYMHRNELKTNDIELLSDDLRVSEEYILKILEDFELFQKDNECYFSKRLIENIDRVAEKSKVRADAVNKRWALSYLKKVYQEIFNEIPVLESDEIEKFIGYYNRIDDFKAKLPDILYTVHKLKFDKIPNFNPSINWLLKENNMARLLNGEFGELRSWQKHKDYLKSKEQQRKGLSVEDEKEEYVFDSKIDALRYIAENTPANITFMNPNLKNVMSQFDITKEEIVDMKREMSDG